MYVILVSCTHFKHISFYLLLVLLVLRIINWLEFVNETHSEQLPQAQSHELRANVNSEVELLSSADQSIDELHTASLKTHITHRQIIQRD